MRLGPWEETVGGRLVPSPNRSRLPAGQEERGGRSSWLGCCTFRSVPISSVPRTALGLVDEAVVVVRERAGVLVPLGLAGYGSAAAVVLVAGVVGGWLGVAVVVVPCLVLVLGTAAAGVIASTPWDRSDDSLEALRAAARRIPALLAFAALASALVVLSLFGFVVLAIPVGAAMSMGFAALLLERCGPTAAVRRGLRISYRHRTRVAGALAVAAVLAVVAAAIGAQAGWVVALLGDGGTAATLLVGAAALAVTAGIGLPVLVAVVAGAYADCRVRNEALDLFFDLDELPAVPA